MSVKIARLTGMNVRALRECMTEAEAEAVTLGATVATFDMSTADALAFIARIADRAAAEHGRSGHPVRSLAAVRRKLAESDPIAK